VLLGCPFDEATRRIFSLIIMHLQASVTSSEATMPKLLRKQPASGVETCESIRPAIAGVWERIFHLKLWRGRGGMPAYDHPPGNPAQAR